MPDLERELTELAKRPGIDRETKALLEILAIGEREIKAGRCRPASEVIAELSAGTRGRNDPDGSTGSP